jgi:hypothetical protein
VRESVRETYHLATIARMGMQSLLLSEAQTTLLA